MNAEPIVGKCHCEKVKFTYNDTPDFAVSCNCSICRRLGTKWIYGTAKTIQIDAPDGTTTSYVWGDREIAFHTCKTCGTTTHYSTVADPENGRVAVNLNLAELNDIKTVKLRHFDGADSWTFLD